MSTQPDPSPPLTLAACANCGKGIDLSTQRVVNGQGTDSVFCSWACSSGPDPIAETDSPEPPQWLDECPAGDRREFTESVGVTSRVWSAHRSWHHCGEVGGFHEIEPRWTIKGPAPFGDLVCRDEAHATAVLAVINVEPDTRNWASEMLTRQLADDDLTEAMDGGDQDHAIWLLRQEVERLRDPPPAHG